MAIFLLTRLSNGRFQMQLSGWSTRWTEATRLTFITMVSEARTHFQTTRQTKDEAVSGKWSNFSFTIRFSETHRTVELIFAFMVMQTAFTFGESRSLITNAEEYRVARLPRVPTSW